MSFYKQIIGICLIGFIGSFVKPALAKPPLWLKPPLVNAVFPKPKIFRHEFVIGASVLPTDAFYVGLAPQIAYLLHFQQWWAWEVLQILYVIRLQTDLVNRLQSYNVSASPFDLNQSIRLIATSNAVIKPFYGKMALFNRYRIHFTTSFNAGAGVLVKNTTSYFAAVLGTMTQLYLHDNLALRFELRDVLSFQQAAPENSIFAGASFSIAFGDMPQ